MTAPILERITTRYVDTEDRVLVTGETADGAAHALLFSQRLLQRLVPALLHWLEGQGTAVAHQELVQSFEQQAACAELAPQAPVPLPPDNRAWLAREIDIRQGGQGVSLTFRGLPEQRANLAMDAKALRQWLGILHSVYQAAEWPLWIWPAWLQQSARPDAAAAAILH